MKLEVSDKSQTNFRRKPHIKKGYYKGVLASVKPRQSQDGTLIETKYGHQLVLLWYVLDENGKAMTLEGEDEPLILANVAYYEYKQPDGSYRTAVTPNSYITRVFQSLGWKFSADAPLDTSEFIGKFAELNIDDYEVEEIGQDEHGNKVIQKYKASMIKDVNPWEEDEKVKEDKA